MTIPQLIFLSAIDPLVFLGALALYLRPIINIAGIAWIGIIGVSTILLSTVYEEFVWSLLSVSSVESFLRELGVAAGGADAARVIRNIFRAIIGVSIPEDLGLVALFLLSHRYRSSSGSIEAQIFICAGAVLLFSCIENYLFFSKSGTGLGIVLVRYILATPHHAARGLLLGASSAIHLDSVKTGVRSRFPLVGVGVAMFDHICYDFTIMMVAPSLRLHQSLSSMLWILVVLGLIGTMVCDLAVATGAIRRIRKTIDPASSALLV